MENYKERACRRVDEILPELSELSDNLWHNPEYNFKEYFACKSMSTLLEKYGLSVETGVGGLETAVKAVYDSGKPGPNIGIFGEFDAVEGMGHSCGHNVMCAIAVGAGAAIREVIGDLGGKVTVFGCPAEEGGGGKIIMQEKGAFKDVDVGMLLHSSCDTVVNDISYSKTDLRVHFYGKTAHAATWPEEGVSALAPVIELFNIVNAMRLELADRGKILGIIRDGGDQAIYIPDHCSAEFTIRSFSMKYKLDLVDRFLKICEHLAEITNTRFEYEQIALPYEDIRNNPVLEDLLAANFTALGETVMPRDKEMGIGCTDMGNLTHEFPGLQSYVRVGPGRAHSPEFLAATGSPEAHKGIAVGAKALAMTAVDLLQDPTAMPRIREAFAEMKARYER